MYVRNLKKYCKTPLMGKYNQKKYTINIENVNKDSVNPYPAETESD